jgi:hypothetical protein
VLALGNNVAGLRNTAVRAFALTQATSNLNTALGFDAGLNVTTASNVVCIGANVAGANVSDSCFIGNIYQKQVGADSLPVRVDSFGKLGTEISSRRFKRQIRSMASASETILAHWGWKAFESHGVEPVFPNKEQVIDYARSRACFRSGEVRIVDR